MFCSAGLGAANPEIVPKLLRFGSHLLAGLETARWRNRVIAFPHQQQKAVQGPRPPAQTPDDSAAAAA